MPRPRRQLDPQSNRRKGTIFFGNVCRKYGVASIKGYPGPPTIRKTCGSFRYCRRRRIFE